VNPLVRRTEEGDLLLANLAPWFLTALRELPEILDPEQPEVVKHRLFPLPADDDEKEEEWRRLVHPELFALLASAREVVQRDLARLHVDEEPWPHGRVLLPKDHVQAWISALNAARLTISELHEIGQEEMDLDEETLDQLTFDRAAALTRIHLYGMLQEMLIRGSTLPPGAPEEELE
jgi:hypothetical protein